MDFRNDGDEDDRTSAPAAADDDDGNGDGDDDGDCVDEQSCDCVSPSFCLESHAGCSLLLDSCTYR